MSLPSDPAEVRVPAVPMAVPVAAPALRGTVEYDDAYENAALPPRQRVTPQVVWRAFRRHWWQVLLLWGIGSAALMTLAYFRVKPTYRAVAQVKVEPGDQSLYVIRNGTPVEFAEFKETQVASVTSPVVLGLALTAHPGLCSLPSLLSAEDAEAEIRQLLKVQIIQKTNLIEIAMSSDSPTEPVEIVNAVLRAYIKNTSSASNEEIKRRIEQLKIDRDNRVKELESQRQQWHALSTKIGAADVDGVKDRNAITPDDYRQLSEQLGHAEIQRLAAEARLNQLKSERSAAAGAFNPDEIEAVIRDAFYADPRVAPLQMQIETTEAKLDGVKRLSRIGNDPTIRHNQDRLKILRRQLAAKWVQLRPSLERTVQSGMALKDYDREVREADGQLAALQSQEKHLREKLDQMKVKSQQAGSEALQLEFARHDTTRAAYVLHKVEDTLNQLEHEASSPIARIREEFPATVSTRPYSNHRNKAMVLAPVAMLFLVMGMFVALERRAGRVADPDELSSRSRLQVLGVVPPLPSLRSSGPTAQRDEYRARRQLDEFIQSLDHLRVVLCARPDPWGRDRRCVLITSACGSEGKTTLAAQLAERCVNAGLMTLLIDADLRNPTLSRMLDAEEHDGLVTVLCGQAAAEDAMIVVGEAGGFHFMPAGTRGTDPSRMLQGDALGKLLAQARESFEMIIVDAPPVLPVPDALTIGRLTDGAVLAVRYDASRFALVDRAHRRLTHVGVPVIGAVVNGVRSMESVYGGQYAYGSHTTAPESPAV